MESLDPEQRRVYSNGGVVIRTMAAIAVAYGGLKLGQELFGFDLPSSTEEGAAIVAGTLGVNLFI